MNEFKPNHITDTITKRDLWLQLEEGRAKFIVIHSVYQSERHQILLPEMGARALLAELTTALAVIAPETEEDNEPHLMLCAGCGLPIDVSFVDYAGKEYHLGCEPHSDEPTPEPAPTDEDTQPLHIPEQPGDYAGID